MRPPAPVTHGSTAARDGATNKVWMGPPRYRIRQRPGRPRPMSTRPPGSCATRCRPTPSRRSISPPPNSCPDASRTSRRIPIPCTGDRAHLQAIHRVLFDGVFDWAGQFRTTDIDKQGTDFVPAVEVETAIDQVFAELAAENLLRGLPREQFIGRLAHYYARLNQIHPFREGNGRTQRLFWGQVALHAGWYVDFVRMSKAANDEASRVASQEGNLEPLVALLDEADPPRSQRRTGRGRPPDLGPAQAEGATLPAAGCGPTPTATDWPRAHGRPWGIRPAWWAGGGEGAADR